MGELRSCPFCGGIPETQTNGPTLEQQLLMQGAGQDWDVSFFVACQCTATGPESSDLDRAEAAWNTRADDGMIKIPTTREEAQAMNLISERWLKDHATPPA